MKLFFVFFYYGSTEALKAVFLPFTGMGENRYLGGVAEKQGIPFRLETEKRGPDHYPSMRLEDLWTERKHLAWGPNFPGDKNVSTDLIYFRKAFEAAISA